MDKSVSTTTSTTNSHTASLTRKRARDGELSFLEKTNNAVIQAKSNNKESQAGEKKMEAQPTPNSNDEKNLLQEESPFKNLQLFSNKQ